MTEDEFKERINWDIPEVPYVIGESPNDAYLYPDYAVNVDNVDADILDAWTSHLDSLPIEALRKMAGSELSVIDDMSKNEEYAGYADPWEAAAIAHLVNYIPKAFVRAPAAARKYLGRDQQFYDKLYDFGAAQMNSDSSPTDIGFDHEGTFVTNPFYEATGRLPHDINKAYDMYGDDNVNNWITAAMNVIDAKNQDDSSEEWERLGYKSIDDLNDAINEVLSTAVFPMVNKGKEAMKQAYKDTWLKYHKFFPAGYEPDEIDDILDTYIDTHTGTQSNIKNALTDRKY